MSDTKTFDTIIHDLLIAKLYHFLKNNIFVKTLNVNIIFSGFCAIDGNIIFSVK